MYDAEKNRIKINRYRTRKELREAGYDDHSIDTIFDQFDWNVATPGDVLSQFKKPEGDTPSKSSSGQGWIIAAGILLAGLALLLGARCINLDAEE